MFIFRNKKLFFLFLVSVFAFSAKAQESHFVYLQTDNGNPFYVKMNHKVISSSPEGYIILPGITDGDYEIAVGFPKKEHPEETFTFRVDNKSEGFLIKDFDEKGLKLFNLETLALIDGRNDSDNTSVASVSQEPDPFSKMLANVVKDSSILQNHQISVDTSVNILGTDTSAQYTTKKTESPDTTASSFPIADSPSVVKGGDSSISKLLSKQSNLGLQMVYADNNEKKTDTVGVFMPVEKEQQSAAEEEKDTNKIVVQNTNMGHSAVDTSGLTITPTVIKPVVSDHSGFVLRKDSIVSDRKDSDINQTSQPTQVFIIGPSEKENDSLTESSRKGRLFRKKGHLNKAEEKTLGIKTDDFSRDKQENNDGKAPDNQMLVLPKVVSSSKVNSDCKAFATNEDFLKLRKKMAAEADRNDMIRVAKKYFKTKCFSTEQIKDLSYLFLNDEGKYMFFDAAYAYTSDSDQYQILESQFTDEYFLNRFKAMIRK